MNATTPAADVLRLAELLFEEKRDALSAAFRVRRDSASALVSRDAGIEYTRHLCDARIDSLLRSAESLKARVEDSTWEALSREVAAICTRQERMLLDQVLHTAKRTGPVLPQFSRTVSATLQQSLDSIKRGALRRVEIARTTHSAASSEPKPPEGVSVHVDRSVLINSPVAAAGKDVTTIHVAIQHLIDVIDQTDGDEEEKAEARSRLERFLAHPLVAAATGGVVSGIARAATEAVLRSR